MSDLPDSAFRAFFENSPQPMWVYDITGLKFLAVNDAACARYGYTREEFMGLTLFDIRPPEEHDRLRKSVSLVHSEANPKESNVWRHFTKSGERLWVEILATPIEFGSKQAGFSVLRDVTESRAQSELLRSSEANLTWAQQISHLGSWSLDVPTMQFTLSDEYYRIAGYEPGGFPPSWENILKCIHPDDHPLIDLGPSWPIASWKADAVDLRMVRPNGEVRFIRGFIEAVFGPDGMATHMHGAILDITEQEQAEESRTWLAAIISSSSEAIIGASLDGIVMSWNHAAEQLFGYSESEMLGQHLVKIVPPTRWDQAEEILANLRNAKSVPEYETELVRKQGKPIEASLLVSPIKTSRGRVIGAAALCRDISGRNRAQRHIAAQIAQLNALRMIDTSIMMTYQLKDTLDVVVDEVLKTIDCESVFLTLADHVQPRIDEVVARRRDGTGISHEEEEANRLVTERAFLERRTVSSGVIRSTFMGHDLKRDQSLAYDSRALLAKGNVVGVLTVGFRTGVKRHADQFQFLDALAGQTAIAIESASLLARLEFSRNELASAYDETLEGWARAIDLRDRETEGHSRRVTDLTLALARLVGVEESEIVAMRRGALLHDIGKLAIPDTILLKQGDLTDGEWQVMRQHPIYAKEFLKPISFLRSSLDFPNSHHEKWDGSGYPEGMKGSDIPIAARIFAFADVWDALRSDRPYRKAWSVEQTLKYFEAESGRHFPIRGLRRFSLNSPSDSKPLKRPFALLRRGLDFAR